MATQLASVKEVIEDWSKIVLVYEPKNSPGTGQVATPDQAQDAHDFIWKWIKENVSEEVGDNLWIVYGGSVNDKNCEKLIKEDDIDGFLVGSARLKPKFREIISSVNDFAVTPPLGED